MRSLKSLRVIFRLFTNLQKQECVDLKVVFYRIYEKAITISSVSYVLKDLGLTGHG